MARDRPGPPGRRGSWCRRVSRGVVQRASRVAALGTPGDTDGRKRGGRPRGAKRRARRAHGAVVGPGRLSRRRLDGLWRANDLSPFEETAPPAWRCVGRGAMIYILLWLLGAPLTLILILFLLGVGR